MGSWVLRALLVLFLAGLPSRSSTSAPAPAPLRLQRQHLASPGRPWGLFPAPTPRLSSLECPWTWSSWPLRSPLSCPRVVRLEDRDGESGFQPAPRGKGGQSREAAAAPQGSEKELSSSCSRAGGRAWSRPCPPLSPRQPGGSPCLACPHSSAAAIPR